MKKNNKVSLDDLRQFLSLNNRTFHFEGFFKKSNTISECAAISVITSQQIITTLTQDDGSGTHDDMLSEIIRAISGLSEQDEHFNNILNNVITIRIWFLNGDKYMAVDFPKNITMEQLTMLKVYQQIYGSEIDIINNETNDDFINCDYLDSDRFHNAQNKKRYTFKDIVTFAEKITSSKKSPKQLEYIIGFTQNRPKDLPFSTQDVANSLTHTGNKPFEQFQQQLQK